MADSLAILSFSKASGSSHSIVRDLEPMGYRAVVREVSSVAQLRDRLAESGPWDLAIIDWVEPGDTGLEVVSVVRRVAPTLPCILRIGNLDVLPPLDYRQPGSPELCPAGLPQLLGPMVARALERAELRRRAAEQNEMLERTRRLDSVGSLAGPMAHELNNLLTPILIAAELLAEDEEQEENRGLLDGLLASSRRAADAVRQLQMFIWGKVSEDRELDLKETMQQLMPLLRFSLPKTIKLEMTVPDDLWAIDGVPAEIFQIMMALAANAREAMAEGGTLAVECEHVVLADTALVGSVQLTPGDYVRILVRDTGTGMPADVLARAGEPFFSTKSNSTGLGLGLATCRELVTRHGGALRIDSTEGKETRVSIYFPANHSTPSSAMS
jgi:signal transduction histidine kinase